MNEMKIDLMAQVESIAEEIAESLGARSLAQIRGAATQHASLLPKDNADAQLLKKIFTIAGIVRYYKIGRNPEIWMGLTEDVILAKKFLGMPTVDEQKQILHDRGLL